MSEGGTVQEVLRRLETNLKKARRIDTPLGAVQSGEHVYVRRNVGDMALVAELEARKGILLRRIKRIAVGLARAEYGSSPAQPKWLKEDLAMHEERLRNRLDLHTVLAIFSASGWADGAIAYARNDPPGSGYAHRTLHLVLVGPRPTDLVIGAHDDLARSLRPVLRGRTDEEEEAIAREHLEKAITLDNYAVLARVSTEAELDPACIERAARRLASSDARLRVEKVRGAGLVLRCKGN